MYKKIQHWQFIPMEKRMQLRKEHNMKPSNPVEVANNKIVMDGISESDLEKVPMEALERASGLKITERKVEANIDTTVEEKEETKLDKSLDAILNETNETDKS